MTKQLIIGLATLSIAGAAIIGSGMYAASTNTGTANNDTPRMEQRDPTAMLASIKSKVSAEAYTALETLMKKHQSEIEALKSSSTTVDEATIKAQREAFKTEMDALLTKYPELKTVMPQGGKMGGERGGKMGGVNPMDDILSGVSDADKTAIEAIHTEYRNKMDTLRTEEKAKVDAIIAKYPELKTKLDTLEANRPTDGQGRGNKMNGHGMRNTKNTTTTSQE